MKGKDDGYEIYSCNKCKNLFSLNIKEKLECPKCKGKKLNRYNPHKHENLLFYKNMKKQGKLGMKDYIELEKFWANLYDRKCPVCTRHSLVWKNG
ncbi:MAG: hypothetical protein ABIJ34_02730 [archaeon]